MLPMCSSHSQPIPAQPFTDPTHLPRTKLQDIPMVGPLMDPYIQGVISLQLQVLNIH